MIALYSCSESDKSKLGDTWLEDEKSPDINIGDNNIFEMENEGNSVEISNIPVSCEEPDGSLCEDGRPCVDGYCCSSICSGICEACNIPGREGICSPLSGDFMCRPAANCCDIPEYCDGLSSECPPDRFIESDPVCMNATEVYFCQPFIEEDEVDARIIPEEMPPNEYFLVRIGNIGPDADGTRVDWSVGNFTGFYPAYGSEAAKYQRGRNNNAETTAVQIRELEIGIWINSDSTPPVVGTLIPITPGYWWWDSGRAHFPWTHRGSELGYSFDLKVPTAQRSGQGEVYVTAYFAFTDISTGQAIWYGTTLMDPRGYGKGYLIAYDDWAGGTGMPIINAALSGDSPFLHPGPGSQTFSSNVWSEYLHFDFRISSAELLNAISAIKRRYCEEQYSQERCEKLSSLSSDPSSYRLDHFNFNPEVHAPAESSGKIGCAIKNIRIILYHNPAEHIFLNAANGSDKPNMQIFFKTLEHPYYDEQKSVWIDFPTGGGWIDLLADMTTNPLWRGYVSGIRIDPILDYGSFGIDFIRIGKSSNCFLKTWEFNGATTVTNPFFGWHLTNITSTWTDGTRWGGYGNGDPWIDIDILLDTGR